MTKAAMLEHFNRARAWMEHSDYSGELERVKNLRPAGVTARYFLRTYARVVLATGFGAKVLDSVGCDLETAFRGYDIEEIARSPDEVTREALQVFGNRKKIAAIVAMAKRLSKENWPDFKRTMTGPEGLEFMETFPGIGPINKYHLARNIGLDYAKPDLRMEQVAEEFGYGAHPQGVFRMVKDIVDATGERPGVVDIVLWRYEVMGRPS